MSARGADALVRLHAEITAAAPGYRPPEELLALVDEEYRGYITGATPGSLYYRWLSLAVRLTKATLIVELGTAHGASAIVMFSELEENARLISCDIAPTMKFVPPAVLNDPRVRFVRGNDLDLNVFGDQLPMGVDLLFIDTEHTFDQVSAEWRIYRHLCNPGAIVVLDDIKMNDMPRFWESLPYPKVDLTEECHFSGFGMFQYAPGEQPNPLTAYREALRIAWERSRNSERDEAQRTTGLRAVWAGLKRRLSRAR